MKLEIILINGTSFGSGKDTVAAFIAKNKQPNRVTYLLRFADQLKLWAEDMSGMTRVVDYRMADVYENVQKDFTRKQKEQFLALWDMTLGQLLQRFATEGVRDGFDQDFWVKMTAKRIERIIEQQFLYDRQPRTDVVRILIPDFRFKNELQLLSYLPTNIPVEMTLYTMKVNRPSDDHEEESRDRGHRSETELSDQSMIWDFEIENNKDLAHLEQKVYDLCYKLD